MKIKELMKFHIFVNLNTEDEDNNINYNNAAQVLRQANSFFK